MRRSFFLRALVLLGITFPASVPGDPADSRPPSTPKLPVARTVDVVDERFGLKAPDPYRWMEGATNPETSDWLKGQGAYTQAYLDRIPTRDSLNARVRELGLSYGAPSSVQLAGGRVFYMQLAPGQQLPKLMVRDVDGTSRLLVDPTTLGHDNTHASVNSFSVSPDGSLLAYDLSEGGSELSTIHVIDVTSGKERPDRIDRVWGEFTASWLSDGSGFFYTQMAPRTDGVDPLLHMTARLHRLGADVSSDPLILSADRAATFKVAPEEFPSVYVPPGSSWIMAYAGGAHSESRFAIAKLAELDTSGNASTPWKVVAEYADGVEGSTLHGSRIYFVSHKNASGRRLLSVPVTDLRLGHARVEIPEDRESPIVSFSDARDGLYIKRMFQGRARFLRLGWNETKPSSIRLPHEGWINDFATDPLRDGVTFGLVDWTTPPTYYSYDPHSGALQTTLTSTYGGDVSGIATSEVEVLSADGTRVPLSILYRKGQALDGSHPTILYGYGGYGVTLNPAFSSTLVGWLERGGVYAVAHVRGGGEKGEAWKMEGKGPNKMNGIRDFIACGEYLVQKGYTRPSRLAAIGGSAGGILVGRAITERPDLFGAANIAVGMVNPLRMLAAENGANQKMELGDPETEAGFKAIYDIDPYQHVKPGTAYPAVLFTIGLNDQRVAPWMTAKMAARLQAATTSGKPILVRLEGDAGHGIGSTRDQAYSERADVWSFILSTTGSLTTSSGKPLQ